MKYSLILSKYFLQYKKVYLMITKNVTIWHNPRCSKSRTALKILGSIEIEINIYLYLEQSPKKEDIMKILKLMNTNARNIMRQGEILYKKNNLKNITEDTTLIDYMIKHPILIERTIVVNKQKAIIGSPPENIF